VVDCIHSDIVRDDERRIIEYVEEEDSRLVTMGRNYFKGSVRYL